MITNFVIGVLIAIVILCIPYITAMFYVYGKPIKEKTLDYFLDKHLNDYGINNFADGKMFCGSDLPYISSVYCFSRWWYIEDQGLVPPWSKWNKILNDRYSELEKSNNNKKTLLDY